MTRLLLLLLLGGIAVLTGCDTPDVPAESGL